MIGDKHEFKLMLCVNCHKEKPRTDAFPSSLYAVCWQCTWEKHIAEKHPPSRAERRKARRRARRIAHSTLIDAAIKERDVSEIGKVARELAGALSGETE